MRVQQSCERQLLVWTGGVTKGSFFSSRRFFRDHLRGVIFLTTLGFPASECLEAFFSPLWKLHERSRSIGSKKKSEVLRDETTLGRCSCSSVVLTDREHSCDFRIAVVGMTCIILRMACDLFEPWRKLRPCYFYSASCKEAPHLSVDLL